LFGTNSNEILLWCSDLIELICPDQRSNARRKLNPSGKQAESQRVTEGLRIGHNVIGIIQDLETVIYSGRLFAVGSLGQPV